MNYLTVLSPTYLTLLAEWALAVVTLLVAGRLHAMNHSDGRQQGCRNT